MIDDLTYDARCPACGEPIDCCQGHGPMGDPVGAAILERHDAGDHRECDPAGCDDAPMESTPYTGSEAFLFDN